MPNRWEILLDEGSLREVLPRQYAHFARPVRDGLAVFLSGLPEEDQAGILRAQVALPSGSSFAHRLEVLARNCPVLQKLGQVLARDQALTPELRQHLRELESLTPTVSLNAIQNRLTEELGPLDARDVTLLPPAIAEASVATVIPFHDRRANRDGVFKVLKPGIEDRLELELRLLSRVGEHLDERCDELGIPHLDYQESFELVRQKLHDEVQLEHEQRHLSEARVFFANEPQVLIPELFEHCTSRVTAMERVFGSKITTPHLDRGKCETLARLVARALIAQPIFSRNDRALFHADPHAGNLFLTNDGRLAILDWSLVGQLGEKERVAVTQIALGAITLDADGVIAVLTQLGDGQLDAAALRTVVKTSLRSVRRGRTPGLSWLVDLLDDATCSARLRVGPDLMLFRKSLHTLKGVVADVGDRDGLIDIALYVEFLKHFAREWPQRWFHLPQTRDYATRISNLDLTRLWLSGPTTAARFWIGHVLDMLETRNPRRSSVPSLSQPDCPCPSNH